MAIKIEIGKITGAVCFLLLSVLAWTGTRLVSRVDTIECNQQRIMIRLGIDLYTADFGVNSGLNHSLGKPDKSNIKFNLGTLGLPIPKEVR